MKHKHEWIEAVILLFCTGILFYSLFCLQGKEYYAISLAIILSGVILFLLKFENRKPSAAELTIIAVMCALAVASRVSFFFLPEVKPMAAVVIIVGISLGAETGFITGAMSAFLSNFYFGQGSWTPFQRFALGLVGFFSGIAFRRIPVNKFTLCLYGVGSVLVLYGGIVDINTLFYYEGKNTRMAVLAVYGASFPFNLAFGISTAVFLVILHKPVLRKLARVKRKYGLIDIDHSAKQMEWNMK